MSQNKSIVAKNQNFIPNSEGSDPSENNQMNSPIVAKNQNFAASSQDSRNAENGYKNNGNAGVLAAKQQGVRNKN